MRDLLESTTANPQAEGDNEVFTDASHIDYVAVESESSQSLYVTTGIQVTPSRMNARIQVTPKTTDKGE